MPTKSLSGRTRKARPYGQPRPSRQAAERRMERAEWVDDRMKECPVCEDEFLAKWDTNRRRWQRFCGRRCSDGIYELRLRIKRERAAAKAADLNPWQAPADDQQSPPVSATEAPAAGAPPPPPSVNEVISDLTDDEAWRLAGAVINAVADLGVPVEAGPEFITLGVNGELQAKYTDDINIYSYAGDAKRNWRRWLKETMTDPENINREILKCPWKNPHQVRPYQKPPGD